jgi:hypothetical protein
LTAGYLSGACLRVIVVSLLILMGMGLLDLFNLAVQVKSGTPVMAEELAPRVLLGRLLAMALLLAAPVAIAVLLAECELVVMQGAGLSISWILVLVPISLALVGGFFGYLFVLETGPDHIVLRLFLLGAALLFFLAGSFQLWFWQSWVSIDASDAPRAWYAAVLCLSGGFLGSMIAWQAPSPYIRSILEYHQHAWIEQTPTSAPREWPSEDLPI